MRVDGQQIGFIFGERDFREASVSKKNGFFGPLVIDAGAGNDQIRVSKNGPNDYVVKVNGQEFHLTKQEMENLTIKGGSGNDQIIVDASVDVEINVKGGNGNDTIQNFADGTTIDGGRGNDLIISDADDCDIKGGRGRDAIYVTGDDNTVRGDGTFWSFLNFGEDRNHRDRLIVEGDGNDVSHR